MQTTLKVCTIAGLQWRTGLGSVAFLDAVHCNRDNPHSVLLLPHIAMTAVIQYSSSVTLHVLMSNLRGAREFRVSDSREPCV